MSQEIGERTLYGLSWTFAGTGIQFLAQMIVLAILARVLTPEEFGLAAAAQVTIGFALISTLLIGPAIIRLPEISAVHIRTGFTVSIAVGVLSTLLVWLIAPSIADLFNMEPLTSVLRMMSFVLLMQNTSIVAESLLQRELKFDVITRMQILSFLLGYCAVGIVLAFLGYGVWALVWACLAQMGLKTAGILIARPHPKSPSIDRQAGYDMIRFGCGLSLASTCNTIAIQGDSLIVGRWLGAGALGLYGRASQLMVLPAALFGQVFEKVLFSALSRLQGSTGYLRLAYKRGIALIAFFVLPVSAVTCVLAPEIIYVLLGPAWSGAVAPLYVFAAGMFFRTGYKMSESVITATGAVYRVALIQFVYAFFVVAGAWVGSRWGLPGVAAGVVGAIMINFLLMARVSLKVTQMNWGDFLSAHLPALALTGVVLAEVWVLAEIMRYYVAPPVALLVTSALVVMMTYIILSRFTPSLVLGEDGQWALKVFREHFFVRLRASTGLGRTINRIFNLSIRY